MSDGRPVDTGAPLLDLEMPAAPEALDAVHDELEGLWEREPDIGPGEQVRFVMAVMEVLGNIVEHAYAPEVRDDQRRLRLAVRREGEPAGTLVGEISDNGRPAALDLSDVVMPDEEAESGRGLALATAALDHLGYGRVDGRNVWTLRCSPR